MRYQSVLTISFRITYHMIVAVLSSNPEWHGWIIAWIQQKHHHNTISHNKFVSISYGENCTLCSAVSPRSFFRFIRLKGSVHLTTGGGHFDGGLTTRLTVAITWLLRGAGFFGRGLPWGTRLAPEQDLLQPHHGCLYHHGSSKGHHVGYHHMTQEEPDLCGKQRYERHWHEIPLRAPGRRGCKLRLIIFEQIPGSDVLSRSCLKTLKWMPRVLPDEQSTLVQAWCRQQQVITWANVDPHPCRHVESLGHNE